MTDARTTLSLLTLLVALSLAACSADEIGPGLWDGIANDTVGWDTAAELTRVME